MRKGGLGAAEPGPAKGKLLRRDTCRPPAGPSSGAVAPGALPELVPGLRWRRVVPGHERQLGVLRRWLESLLPQCPARDHLTAVGGRLIWADVRWADTTAAAVVSPDPYEAAIRDGEAALARSFAGVPTWFGRSTLQWWAMVGTGGLVTAPSARELGGLLDQLLDAPPPATAASSHRAGSPVPCGRA